MRWWRIVFVGILILAGGVDLHRRAPQAAAVGEWQGVAGPPRGRDGGSSRPDLLLLPDGRVFFLRLISAPAFNTLAVAAAIYDPGADRWADVAPPDPRAGFATPVLLRDGRILIAGGSDGFYGLNATFTAAGAQLYDPATGRWSAAGSLAQARTGHTATLLRDGTVLVVGGQDDTGIPLATAERFDPRTGRWRAAGALATIRVGHTATLLPDGRVLVVGGQAARLAAVPSQPVPTAELYDPATDRWSPAAQPLRVHGADHTATLLADGRLLVAGGRGAIGNGFDWLTATELYDPARNAWTVVAPLRQGSDRYAATLLRDGRVLAVATGVTQIYDPARDLWSLEARTYIDGALATLLDGRVLNVNFGAAAIYTPASPERTCFAETGHCIAGRFLRYWREHGGLAINGFPLTDEQVEVLEDGNAYTVQYFERSRLEYHPENDPPYDVLLGQFGRRMLSAAYGAYVQYSGYQGATAPVAPLDGARYFPETGHNLGGRFLAYWEANGGLAQFGYPLTEERWDTLPSDAGACCHTQYFERARFEYHPENAGTPYEVLLGQFGRRIMEDNALLSGEFGRLYLSQGRARERLGAPTGPAVQVPGSLQPFENGLMIWRGDQRQIFVLIGTLESGAVPGSYYGRDIPTPDTWAEGQDPGGGPAPVPGRFLPQRGFGKLWRERGLVNSLGYATTPNEFAYTLMAQPFAAGWLLTTEGPSGHSVYAIYFQAVGSHNAGQVGIYERIAAR